MLRAKCKWRVRWAHMMNSKLIVIKTKRAFLHLFCRINKYLWRIVEEIVVEPVHLIQLKDL